MLRALDLANLPDADVVALALEGRDVAHRELITRYERPVFSIVFRMVGDRELAEDLTQDTFVKVLSHLDRYRADFKFSSWLFKIANNVAIDHLRRRQLDTVSIDGSAHAVGNDAVEASRFDIPDGSENALDEMEAKELGSAIERAIAYFSEMRIVASTAPFGTVLDACESHALDAGRKLLRDAFDLFAGSGQRSQIAAK